MKKLLVLFLVCGMASVASAALSVAAFESDGVTPYAGRTLSASEDLIFEVSSDAAEQMTSGWAGIWIEGSSQMALGTLAGRGYNAATDDWASSRTAITGSLGRVKTADGSAYQGFGFISGQLAETSPGLWYTVDFHCEGAGAVDVIVYNDSGTVAGTVTVNQIPEPITMTLLGFGGLGLLRRRR